MNRYQPGANRAAVGAHIDARIKAAENYRHLRAAKGPVNTARWTKWRCAVVNKLRDVGEGLIAPRSPALPTR